MFQQGQLYCDVCEVQIQSLQSMQWHVRGKRHERALQYWNERKELAKFSVFVRGFPTGTTEEDLWNYFSGFGEVSKVTIVKPRNLYAIVEFQEVESVQYALQTQNHRLNSQNIIVKSREVEIPGQVPQYQEDYNQFPPDGNPHMDQGGMGPPNFRGQGGPQRGLGMMHYGPGGQGGPGGPGGQSGPWGPGGQRGPGGSGGQRGPGGSGGQRGPGGPGGQRGPGGPGGQRGPGGPGGQRGPGGPGGRGGHYNQPGPSHGYQDNEGWYDGPFPEEPQSGNQQGSGKKKKQDIDEQMEQFYHQELMEKLDKVKGVQTQLEWMCQTLQVTAEEAQTKFTLCEKLQEVLGRFFPGCTVNQFGSSVNGFGITGCDMDIFLDLTTMHGRTWELQPIRLPFVRDFKFLSEKEWGPLIPKDLDMMGLGDQCKLISRILTDNMDGILGINVIQNTRCPIVRFNYSGLDTKCDLSVNNKMALQNTKLLYLYSVLNSRVRLLVYAIRYWGKVKGLSGNQQSSTKLSNYAITLMVLNYLQNLDPPVLPTIEKLSLLHGPNDRTKIEGWDTTFAMDWQIIPQSNNTKTAAELLPGFFAYWSEFKFTDNILLTRTATTVPFTTFYDKNQMNDGRLRAFKAASVNIQDPFVLNHNITHNVNEKMKDKIVREFRIAAIKSSKWDPFANLGADLIQLLNNEVPEVILKEEEQKHNQIMERGRMPSRRGGKFSFDIELNPKTLSNRVLKNIQKGSDDNFRVEWCKRMCSFVTRILKEVLLLTFEDLPEGTDEEKQRIEEEMRKKQAADEHNATVRKRRDEKIHAKKVKLKAEFDERKKKEKEEKEQREKEIKEKEAEAEEEGFDDKEDIDEDRREERKGRKRLVPASILEIDPKDTRKRMKPFEEAFDWDQHVELTDDEDEDEKWIEYQPNVPVIRYKRDSSADVNIQYYIRAWCMTWARRKKAKNYLVNEEGRDDEGLEMEKLISNAIWKNDKAPLRRPVVGFYLYMDSLLQGEAETKIQVSMECKEGDRDFNTFFQFSKMYLYKMIDKYFN